MRVRAPSVAGMFYPAQERACRAEIESCLEQASEVQIEGTLQGGIVPHAGWIFSGPVAARVFAALCAQGAPESVVLFGAVHSWGVGQASSYGSGAWQTPLGAVDVDEELAEKVMELAGTALVDDPQAHAGEHSIEVQLPFIKYLFPEARIVPIAMPLSASALKVGRAAAKAAREIGRRTVAIGSSDLTHYGPRYGLVAAGAGQDALSWAKQNDGRLLDLVVSLRADQIVGEAQEHHNACGAAAIAATIGYVEEMGATRGLLLEHTTSHEVMPMGRPTDFVGYGAVAFV